jgi:hypothetical protein
LKRNGSCDGEQNQNSKNAVPHKIPPYLKARLNFEFGVRP